MEDAVFEDLRTFLPPLLRGLEGLGFVARRLNPAHLERVLAVVAEPRAGLAEARPRLDDWPEALAGLQEILQVAADEALAAYEELGAADDMRSVYRALRHAPRAQEALYPLAEGLPPVSRYFLTPARRDDAQLMARFANAPERDDVGVFHLDNDPGSRGGFSLYVPETYEPQRPHPVVFALHGGAGSGRSFLWSWLRDARAAGAIVVAPTAVGDTWALQGPDADSPNLARILGEVRARWTIDERRLLLTGMSDGGTFSYVSGLLEGSPFTHLAPACAAFHPLLTAFGDERRIRGLPIHVTHGVHDWMFAVDMAREAEAALAAAGARVTYREIEDLSHCYPTEVNPDILAWMDETTSPTPPPTRRSSPGSRS
jgi:phospholipase/carboxylesterase